MQLKYLIVIAAIGGLYGLFLSRDNAARAIGFLMLLAIGWSFLPKGKWIEGPFILYSVALFFAILYLLLKPGLHKIQRALMLAIALPVLLANVFALQHWPHTLEVKATTLISLAAFIAICFRPRGYRDQFSFLIIMTFDALIQAIILFGVF